MNQIPQKQEIKEILSSLKQNPPSINIIAESQEYGFDFYQTSKDFKKLWNFFKFFGQEQQEIMNEIEELIKSKEDSKDFEELNYQGYLLIALRQFQKSEEKFLKSLHFEGNQQKIKELIQDVKFVRLITEFNNNNNNEKQSEKQQQNEISKIIAAYISLDNQLSGDNSEEENRKIRLKIKQTSIKLQFGYTNSVQKILEKLYKDYVADDDQNSDSDSEEESELEEEEEEILEQQKMIKKKLINCYFQLKKYSEIRGLLNDSVQPTFPMVERHYVQIFQYFVCQKDIQKACQILWIISDLQGDIEYISNRNIRFIKYLIKVALKEYSFYYVIKLVRQMLKIEEFEYDRQLKLRYGELDMETTFYDFNFYEIVQEEFPQIDNEEWFQQQLEIMPYSNNNEENFNAREEFEVLLLKSKFFRKIQGGGSDYEFQEIENIIERLISIECVDDYSDFIYEYIDSLVGRNERSRIFEFLKRIQDDLFEPDYNVFLEHGAQNVVDFVGFCKALQNNLDFEEIEYFIQYTLNNLSSERHQREFLKQACLFFGTQHNKQLSSYNEIINEKCKEFYDNNENVLEDLAKFQVNNIDLSFFTC